MCSLIPSCPPAKGVPPLVCVWLGTRLVIVMDTRKIYACSFFLLVFQERQALFNQAVSNDSQSSQEQRVNIKLNTSSVSLSLRYSFNT